MSRRPHTLAFAEGQLPQVACVNLATRDLGVDFGALVTALQDYVSGHFAPVWGWPAKVFAAKNEVPPGCWGLVFTDNATVADALGYHDLTPECLPLSHVFVATSLDNGSSIGEVASHELGEMLCDPGAATCVWNEKQNCFYALEPGDPVQRSNFKVNDIEMSSFVFPSWFEESRKPGSCRFDYLGECRRPFQITKGGYMPVWRPGTGWGQVFGSKSAEAHFKASSEGRRGAMRAAGLRRVKKSAAKKPAAVVSEPTGKTPPMMPAADLTVPKKPPARKSAK